MIYIADDDPQICLILERLLTSEGFEVLTFHNGVELFEAFVEKPSALVITDIMMPKMDGYELCLELRKISDVPIVMLSAKGEEQARIAGLELGSDDYLTKPVSLKELSLKVKHILQRRKGRPIQQGSAILACHDLSIDGAKHMVLLNGCEFKVTEKEYTFLELFMSNCHQSHSRETIIRCVWGYEAMDDTKFLDHFVKRLRKKLASAKAVFEIETVWGFGYRIKE